LTHYTVIREDLPLGLLAAQLVHAAGESSPGNLPEGTYAVVLAVPDEASLLAVHRALEQRDLDHVLIHEPDNDTGFTAIGLSPTRDRRSVRRVLGQLPLLRERAVA